MPLPTVAELENLTFAYQGQAFCQAAPGNSPVLRNLVIAYQAQAFVGAPWAYALEPVSIDDAGVGIRPALLALFNSYPVTAAAAALGIADAYHQWVRTLTTSPPASVDVPTPAVPDAQRTVAAATIAAILPPLTGTPAAFVTAILSIVVPYWTGMPFGTGTGVSGTARIGDATATTIAAQAAILTPIIADTTNTADDAALAISNALDAVTRSCVTV